MTLSFAAARDALLAGLFGDTRQADHARPRFALDMLSDWLPYRVYDEETGLYRNAHSKGFVLEVTPLIGADERTGEILGQFFSESLPQGACLQVLNFASPRIGAIVGPWFGPRYEQGGIYEAKPSPARASTGSTTSSGARDRRMHRSTPAMSAWSSRSAYPFPAA